MLEHLKKILAQEDTVIFLGSGISRWSGLPSWGQLIEELSAFLEARGVDPVLVQAEATRGDLLQAASYGFHQLTKPQIGEFIKNAVRQGLAKPHKIHEKIVRLGTRCFITTNYDSLLEESLRKWRQNWPNRPL